MKTRLKAFSTVIVCAAIGCGSPSTGSVDSFITSYAQALCDWQFKCCTAAEIMQQVGTKYKDSMSCLQFQQLTLEDQLYAERLAVRQGRIKVDGTQASACLSEQQNKMCNPAPGTTPPPPMTGVDPCTLVFVGNTAIGDACLFANECIKGAHCVPTGAAGEGVCVPYQEQMQICNQSSDCDPTVTNLYCAKKDYTCRVRSPIGGPCAYTIDPTTQMPTTPLLLECDTSSPNTTVYCDSASMTCKQLPGAGQACLAAPLPLGAPGRCDTGLVCDTSGGMPGTCRGPGNVGDDCTNIACNTMLYCDRSVTPNTCKTLPSLGEQCQPSGGRCIKPYYCNFQVTPAVCAAPAQLGQMCSFQVQCDAGLYCDNTTAPNTCKMLLPDGSTCTSSLMCASGRCTFIGGTGTCAPSQVIVQCIGH